MKNTHRYVDIFNKDGELLHKPRQKLQYLSIVIILSLFTTLGALLFYIANARMSACPYDTTLDYHYNFDGTDAKIFELKLQNCKFQLPQLPQLIGGNYSAFLKISISTKFMGKIFQPEAQLTSNDISISEYFENGAQGVRYINISSLLSSSLYPTQIELTKAQDKRAVQKKSVQIQLKGKRVLFKDQPIQLILFKNQDIANSRILIIAPHPDDAEIAAFGLYSSLSIPNTARLSGNSKNIYIVTVTAGDAGTYQYDEIYSNRKNHFLKKGKIRTWNSITVPLLGGIPAENILNLGFFDGTLKEMFDRNPATVKALYTGISNINIFRRQNISPLVNILEGDANWDSLVNNLESLLKEIEPDIIVASYPALDHHPDHKFSSIALFEAIKRAAISNKDKKIEKYQKDENYESSCFKQNDHEKNDFRSNNSHDIRRGYLYLYTNHFVLNEYYPYGENGGVVSLPPAFMDNSIYFKSIYSHPLSPDREREKILSLDAMNDLRPDTSWRFSKDAVKMAIASLRRDIMGKNVSYYRRAVRNNELFFVMPVSDIYNQSVLNRIVGKVNDDS